MAGHLELALVLAEHVRSAKAPNKGIALAPAPERLALHLGADSLERLRQPREAGVCAPVEDIASYCVEQAIQREKV